MQLYTGDCRSIIGHADLAEPCAIITDPPYGIINKFGVQDRRAIRRGVRRLQFDWDIADGVAEVIATAAAHSQSAFVFCGFDTIGPVQSALRGAGLIPKPFAWIKHPHPYALPGNWWPSGFEAAVYAYRPGAWFGDRNPRRVNVWTGDALRHGNGEKLGPPCQKPLSLMRHVVLSIAPPGALVIDPYMGTGTTGVACLLTGRRFVGIEIDRRRFTIARNRITAELAAIAGSRVTRSRPRACGGH